MIRLTLGMIALLFQTSCWTWYTGNPTYKKQITDPYKEAPSDQLEHVEQWVGQMFDAELTLELLDAHCQTPTIYSDLEFQIHSKDKQLFAQQLQKKTFSAKVYLKKDWYVASLESFSRGEEIGRTSFQFKGDDRKVSIKVKCR
ncbi:hypothetical protein [Pseudobacteriovorax antillogorgiicola]|uniref:Uncharacterized protein n=1 Tax=Pseudobacteriovorax antillogorgiicola TaxID=1513793 RepID=A0A1Y6BAD0_9BACT|nr:hypothetical protein [Pseudobacteriovorax antillogorgiicola]TCS58556.1 hypothetical protein EDD56_10269 [Pseudobacteriovorax antillogorgiicola]SME97644.1 hypothetical protein SAMN06296036_102374 [Pseudobacteriovorax antillogorgiicola]